MKMVWSRYVEVDVVAVIEFWMHIEDRGSMISRQITLGCGTERTQV